MIARLARSVRHRALIPMAAALALSIGRLPVSVLRAISTRVAGLLWLADPRARRRTLSNLARAFPNAPLSHRVELGRAAYVHLGEVCADLLAILSGKRVFNRVELTADAQATFARAMSSGRGVVLVSAHLGPWEEVAQAILRAGIPLTAVVRTPPYPTLARLLRVIRGSLPTIDRDRPGAALSMLRALRRGGVLGIPMDLSTRAPSIDAPFFDCPARTPVGPAKLALRTHAALLAATAVRSADGAVRVTCTHISTSHFDTPEALTCAINRELCARIRAYPEGWLWMHPRFERP